MSLPVCYENAKYACSEGCNTFQPITINIRVGIIYGYYYTEEMHKSTITKFVNIIIMYQKKFL